MTIWIISSQHAKNISRAYARWTDAPPAKLQAFWPRHLTDLRSLHLRELRLQDTSYNGDIMRHSRLASCLQLKKKASQAASRRTLPALHNRASKIPSGEVYLDAIGINCAPQPSPTGLSLPLVFRRRGEEWNWKGGWKINLLRTPICQPDPDLLTQILTRCSLSWQCRGSS